MNKRKLYESIMMNVAKLVKKVLNEEAIYEPGILDPEEGKTALNDKKDSTHRFLGSKLQDMLKDPMDVDEKFIEYALNAYKTSGQQYNPHLDGDEFQDFIEACVEIQGNNANLNWIDTSDVTDMSYLFGDRGLYILMKEKFNGDISAWDVSNVKNMKGMFLQCYKFNCNLSKWNVSNVTDMSYMFYDCENFEGNGLERWDVSNVVYMQGMFERDKSLRCDLSKWNVSNVVYMQGMFMECKDFDADLSKWDVHHVKDMTYMFARCDSFNCDLSNWNVYNVRKMTGMFYDCRYFMCDLSKWDVSNHVDTFRMFYGTKMEQVNKMWPKGYEDNIMTR